MNENTEIQEKQIFTYYYDNISDAIEMVTHKIQTENPQAFFYRNRNLKFALCSSLYVENNLYSCLYQVFRNYKLSGKIPTNVKLSYFQKEILNYMIKDSVVLPQYTINDDTTFLKKLIEIRSKFYFSMKVIFSKWLWQEKIVKSYFKEKKQVLFFIHNDKFCSFLDPLMDKIDNVAFLLTNTQNDSINLSSLNYKYIDATRKLKYRTIEKVDSSFQNHKHLAIWYDNFYDTLQKIKPSCIVVVEGLFTENEVLNQVCHELSIPIICIQHGFPANLKPNTTFRYMSYTRFCTWGSGISNLLKPYNPNQNFVITGSHSLSIISPRNQDNKNQSITFFLPPRMLSSFGDFIWDQWINLILWTSNQFQKEKILVREHPKCQSSLKDYIKIKDLKNIEFVNYENYTLKDVFCKTKITVCGVSTIVIESLISGIIPLIFNLTSLNRYYPDIEKEKVGFEVDNIHKAEKIIEQMINDNNYVQNFTKEIEHFQKVFLSSYSKEKSIQNIKNIIKELSNL